MRPDEQQGDQWPIRRVQQQIPMASVANHE